MQRYCLLVAVMLCGCGTREASLKAQGIVPLNRNAQGEDCPIDIRVYKLKDSSRFQAAEFNELWKDDKTVLGETVLGDRVQLTVFPGTEDTPAVVVPLGELESGVRFIGVMALYAKKDGDNPRRVLIPADDVKDKTVILTGSTIRLK